ncbi:MAG: thiamine-phosphate kinase [Thermotogae bacterium]|nr:thiamine-phosphate kinase [Thermotogota bacterium]
MREDDLIKELTEQFSNPHPRVEMGVGDDCSLISQNPGRSLLISVDTFVEGVHFNFDLLTPAEVGYRGLAGALSDIAAMGGEPLAFLLNVQTPKDYLETLKRIYSGFLPLSEKYCVSLVGGNLSRGGELALTFIVLGEAPRKGKWLRSGANEGDVLFVTGDLGRVKAFFMSEKLSPEGNEWWYVKLREKFAHPVPRIEEAKRLRAEGVEVSAAIDISDGLSIDAYRMAKASGVRIVINGDALPIDDSVKYVAENLNKDPEDIALASGEEYELLFTVPERWAKMVEGMGYRRIGRVEPGPEGVFDEEGNEIKPTGWQHF